MEDQSYLDTKYFIDSKVYDCPFCNRRHVSYTLLGAFSFNWTAEKICYVYFIRCQSCNNDSMHLSYHMIFTPFDAIEEADIDEHLFYSQPRSHFAMDDRIPKEIREAVTEAEGCQKMNYLTGASACARKAIFEMTALEGATGDDYRAKIKSLKEKFSSAEPELFDTLAAIHGMTSDQVHEQSWPKWDSQTLHFLLETLKLILNEIYVRPSEKKKSIDAVRKLKKEIDKKGKKREPKGEVKSSAMEN